MPVPGKKTKMMGTLNVAMGKVWDKSRTVSFLKLILQWQGTVCCALHNYRPAYL
jgi:hypothetical protein